MKVKIELTADECLKALAKYLIEERGVPADPAYLEQRAYFIQTDKGIEARCAMDTADSFSQGPYR